MLKAIRLCESRNLLYGLYLCERKGNWQAGQAHLQLEPAADRVEPRVFHRVSADSEVSHSTSETTGLRDPLRLKCVSEQLGKS